MPKDNIVDSFAARLPTRPAAYLCLFLVWAVTLWFLSERIQISQNTLCIPHTDKVAHFLYFFAGGALLAAFGGLKQPRIREPRLFLAVMLVCCVTGRLDEFHQGFTPGRTGNDNADWLADILGGASGAWVVITRVLPGMRRSKAGKGKKIG